MGIGKEIETLCDYGFEIIKDGGNYTVIFSKEKSFEWEQFICKNLKEEYWNEYITENSVIFIFNLKDGIKRYEVFDYDNDEVLQLCETLCECKFGTIKNMLLSNHFYKSILS